MSKGTVGSNQFWSSVPEWLSLNPDVSDRAVRLFVILDSYVHKHGQAIPSRRRLADQMGCSIRSVDAAKDELVELGAITVTNRMSAAGDPTSNQYTVNFVAGGVVQKTTLPRAENDTTVVQETRPHKRLPSKGRYANGSEIAPVIPPMVGTPGFEPCPECGLREGRHRYDCPLDVSESHT